MGWEWQSFRFRYLVSTSKYYERVREVLVSSSSYQVTGFQKYDKMQLKDPTETPSDFIAKRYRIPGKLNASTDVTTTPG